MDRSLRDCLDRHGAADVGPCALRAAPEAIAPGVGGPRHVNPDDHAALAGTVSQPDTVSHRWGRAAWGRAARGGVPGGLIRLRHRRLEAVQALGRPVSLDKGWVEK